MKGLINSAVLTLLFLAAVYAHGGTIQTLVVRQPAIIAFFPPTTEADLEQDADTNEVLGDFQLYAMRVGPALKKAGIDFEVVNAKSFKIRIGRRERTYHAGKVGVGYYFIAPGRKPHVELGVMTDQDILEVAGKYFKLKISD